MIHLVKLEIDRSDYSRIISTNYSDFRIRTRTFTETRYYIQLETPFFKTKKAALNYAKKRNIKLSKIIKKEYV